MNVQDLEKPRQDTALPPQLPCFPLFPTSTVNVYAEAWGRKNPRNTFLEIHKGMRSFSAQLLCYKIPEINNLKGGKSLAESFRGFSSWFSLLLWAYGRAEHHGRECVAEQSNSSHVGRKTERGRDREKAITVSPSRAPDPQ
jgi:hypothetical protein